MSMIKKSNKIVIQARSSYPNSFPVKNIEIQEHWRDKNINIYVFMLSLKYERKRFDYVLRYGSEPIADNE